LMWCPRNWPTTFTTSKSEWSLKSWSQISSIQQYLLFKTPQHHQRRAIGIWNED
jgi:hypothetical protein